MGIGKWPGQLISRSSKLGSKMSNLDGKKLISYAQKFLLKKM